ncbi:uncharacterized protein N0V89_011021 [Didymosphaeria variabile]|uniref:Uncharacterized protein n=1 Tax=Didymosphaeria variabile TaxID=1932322 RepID=A0A9W8XCE5_9PLEO|nr:uncharacterized protein N0V89_011021 [Didymosphaeria variabile]KAJ4347085.1 hypothetical protein N0V89_011021 [Didymosphaeria variabile]
MAEETFDEDIFDDLYDEPEEPAKSAPAPAAPAALADSEPVARNEPAVDPAVGAPGSFDGHAAQDEYAPVDGDAQMASSNFAGAGNQGSGNEHTVDDNYGPINVKEDG